MKYAQFLLACIMVALLGSATAFAAAPVPHIPEPEGAEKCVEPEDVMRRQHFEFIKHQRDETMRRGIRTSKYSFKECINCHVVKDEAGRAVSIEDDRHFCNACHSYAAVTVDCFQCHKSTPAEPKMGSLEQPERSLAGLIERLETVSGARR